MIDEAIPALIGFAGVMGALIAANTGMWGLAVLLVLCLLVWGWVANRRRML